MKRILAAVDLTSTAHLIIRHAVELARSMGGRVRLLHSVVIAPQVPPPGVFVPLTSFRAHELADAARTAMESLEESIPRELRDGVVVEIGHAADCVCEAARAYDADVVVIGAHDYGLISRALGTTAARIVNRMDRPVFVVRPMPTSHVAEPEPVSAKAG